MARIRSIKPEFCTSEQITECSPNARLTFILMWLFCDDYGVHPAEPKRLKMEIFPGDDINSTQVRSYIDELINSGLLEEYKVEKEMYWRVTGWDRHQKIDQRTGKYPLPDGIKGGKIRRTPTEHSKNIQGTSTEHSPPEWRGVEGSGEEKNGKEKKEQNIYPNANKQSITAQTPSQLKEYWKPEIQIIIDYFNEKKRSIGMSSNITINDGSCNIIAERLNELSGQPFTAISPEETQKCLEAASNHTGKNITVPILQCFYVILGRIEKWSDDEKMKTNLSISTIFKAEKFQHYLDEYISTMDLTS